MQDPLAFVIAFAHIAASLALLNGVVVALGQGKVAATAVESIARQPEAAGAIRSTMLLGLAMSETSAIYGVVISIIMLFANPLVSIFLQHM